MDSLLKSLSFLRKRARLHILILLIIGFLGISPFFELDQGAEADLEVPSEEMAIFSEFSIIQGNSLQPILSPSPLENELKVTGKIKVVVTAYSSSPWETDDTPYLTAAGTQVREGIVATNILPFGTKIKLPKLYGDKIFVVEDRMSSKKTYHIDIWFPSRWQALNFGAEITYIEILES